MASIRTQNALGYRTTISGVHFASGSLPFWRLEGGDFGFAALP